MERLTLHLVRVRWPSCGTDESPRPVRARRDAGHGSRVAAAAAADDGKLQVRLTPAGQAAARAASLTTAELGAGWAGGLQKSTGVPTPLCPTTHARESDLVLTGVAVTGFRNAQAGFSIGSDVQLLRTSKMVQLDWQRTVVRPGVVACLRAQFAADARSSERIASVRKLPFPRVTPYAAAYRIVYQAPGSGTQRGNRGHRAARARSDGDLAGPDRSARQARRPPRRARYASRGPSRRARTSEAAGGRAR